MVFSRIAVLRYRKGLGCIALRPGGWCRSIV